MFLDVDVALGEVPVNIVPLTDDGDFKTIEESVAYDATGMELIWHFITSAGAYSATVVTPTTGGTYDWAHQDGGMYTIEIPASGGASINNDTEGYGWFTGKATGVLPWRGPTIGFRAAGLNDKLTDSAYSTTRGLGGTALPDAAADAAGGLVISDAGGLDIDAKLATATSALGTAAELAKVPKSDSNVTWNATALASVNAEVDGAIETYHLDHLLAATYDPASKPGAADALLNELVESDSGVSRFTANALEQGPGGGSNPFAIASGTIGSTGNSTTALHLTGLTYGNDELNDCLLIVRDVSESEYHARWVDDWVLSSELATVATLPFTPQNATDTYVVLGVRRDVNTATERQAIATALLDLTAGVETSATVRQALRVMLAAMAGDGAGFPGGPVTYKSTDGTKNRITTTAMDGTGNRTVTRDVS